MKPKLFRSAAALILALSLAVGLCACTQSASDPDGIDVTVVVVHKDKSEKVFEVTTQGETLEDVLLEHKIVEDNQSGYGLYILTADGETADESAQEWWCVTKGGESMATGASDTVIADGDHYELTFTVGW